MIIRYKTNERGASVPVARIYTQKEHPVRNTDIDKDALWAIRKIQANGAVAYIVGGAVRDLLLGNKPKDFDIATSASPRQIQRLFWNARIIGKRFRIVHLFFNEKIIEVTTFRSEMENFEEGNNNIFGTIEEDSMRRDFSINSLYYNPANGQILDFTHSMEDFKKKVIRSLIPLKYSFSEDPVRMIRAVKYNCSTGFKLRFDVRRAIRHNALALSDVSTSRLTEEVNKIISSGHSFSILEAMQHYKLLVHMLPCYSVYITYPAVMESLKALDAQVLEAKNGNGEEVTKAQMILAIISPLIILQDEYPVNEDRFKDVYRQAKVLISPMTPPNYEVEKACDLYLAENGFKSGRIRKTAIARMPKKKPGAMLGKKSAANEELSKPNEIVAKKKRKRRHHRPGAELQMPPEAATAAEAHDF